MPALKVFTNVSRVAIPKNFIKKLTPVLSKSVQKPEDKFVVMVSPDCFLSLGGNEQQPAVVASLESIGNLGPEQNQIISRDVTDVICKELGVDKQRVFITFYDLLPSNVAINGATREGF